MSDAPVSVEIFSDALCVWAFAAQIRIDELKRAFGARVELHYRFTPVFSACRERIKHGWEDKGGFQGFNENLMTTAVVWDHISLHPDIWIGCVPESSTVPHLYLKAAQLLEQQGRMAGANDQMFAGRSLFEEFYWQLRRSFFEQAENISDSAVIKRIGARLGLPVEDMQGMVDTGVAHAALHLDQEAHDRYMVPGSPTLVFNEGRQRLYGNIGYRIIEANIRELLHHAEQGEPSWC